MRSNSATRINEFVRSIYEPCSEKELKLTITQGLLQLIAGEETILTTSEVEQTAIGSYTDKNRVQAVSYLECLKKYLHESPAFHRWVDPDYFGTIVLSDYTSRLKWHRTSLYNEFFRPQALEDHLAVKLVRPAADMIGIAVLRHKWGFSNKERGLMNLLLPHFNQAFKNARQFSLSVPTTLIAEVESDASDGMILLDNRRRVVYCPEKRYQVLNFFFGSFQDRPGQLPEELDGWLKISSAIPYKKNVRHEAIEIRSCHDSVTGKFLLSLRVTGPRSAVLKLAGLGLSPRESEVLYWIAQGKRNEEIAAILDLSFFTVKTHLKNIFRRLNVETRTAAAALALQLL